MATAQDDTNAEIAERIRTIMDEKGVSFLALSKSTGLPYTTLRGSIIPAPTTGKLRALRVPDVGGIAAALEVRPSELLPQDYAA